MSKNNHRPLFRKKRRSLLPLLLVLLIALVWFHNTSLFIDTSDHQVKLLAHRGLAQTFDVSRVQWDTDTSKIIYPPDHRYIENTLSSMEAAFSCGAAVVELDVQSTADDQLAVFHDFELGYRTEGAGQVSDHEMAYLKTLDLGHGYTADGGISFPFRGRVEEPMPELREVFAHFPEHELLLHIKDTRPETAEILWGYLAPMTTDQRARITVYGPEMAMDDLGDRDPSLRLMSKNSMKRGLVTYLLTGWTGYIPRDLRNTELHLPIEYAKFLWGWPHRFTHRMDAVDTRVVLTRLEGDFSAGFDTTEDLKDVPGAFDGYLWTNRIDRMEQLFNP